jgi:hypothetical protein
MRPGRPLLTTAILLAGIALAGCTAGGAPATSAAPATPAAPGGATATTSNAPTTAATPTTTTAPPQSGGRASDACAGTRAWGTGAKQSSPYTQAPLYLVRVGRHDCYDRVVLVINTPQAVGFHVQYVSVVRDDGSGRPRPVAGGAALEVIVHAPPQGLDDQGHQPWRAFASPGQVLYGPAQLAGWRSLREVRYANSFEGQSTLAVGVRERLPFRAFALADTPNHVMRVVLDIAH